MDNLNLAAILSGDIEQDLDAQTSGLSRQRKIADMLLAQGQQMAQGQMVSGRFVKPSFTQQLAPLANTAASFFVNDRADQQEREVTKAQRLRTAMQVQKFAELEKENPGMAMQYGLASNNKALQAIVAERMKGDKLSRGDVLTRTGLTGEQIKLEGGPDELPNSIQEAIAFGQLPPNPKDWTPAQAAKAEAINLKGKKAGATYNDFGALLNKNAPDDVLKMMTEGKIQATGAIQTADAANRIISALDSNKIFTGMGANVKIGAAQLADGLGLGGKDTTEKLGNSRQAMQGLAQLTLQGRKQMRGEGAITESESRLAERAMSGDINFTAAEIRQLANAAKRAAQFTYNNYNNMQTQLMQDSPRVAPYYKIDANPDIFSSAARPAATVGQSQTQGSVIDKANQIINGKK
jgi:hypothetical protein